jgi:C4-dicarboxylate-specific signal transduction histidine kinase
MAAGIGHELTQPLNAILLFARNGIRALSDPSLNKKMIEDNFKYIIDRVNKASSIIKSLKSFGSKSEGPLEEVSVNSIILDILHFLNSQLMLSEISVELSIDENLPSVMAQEVKIEQVFLNLIQNAIQAMGKSDKPVLRIKTGREKGIDAKSLQQKTFIVVSIEDNGEGIPEEQQEKIFDPFYTTREVGAGMGLGLSIVDRIVREFSGHIRLASASGRGSCFSVFFPIETKINDLGEVKHT